ncbi:hypothetical protein [Agrobacterium sp. NPDC089420]|uniref:hypothetical protein n=1 Tax=Agrobacterium sp. NPDC089420 TaxID=3363918 RepID=UPI00384FA110
MGEAIKQAEQDRFEIAHPSISEIHVNLSGHNLGPDSGSYESGPLLSADCPDMSVKLTSYATPASVEGHTLPNAGAHLKDGIDNYRYRKIPYPDAPPAHDPLPLHRFPYPDLRAFLDTHGGNEADAIVHLYFHYDDHVDVTPAVRRFSMTQEMPSQQRNMHGLVLFGLYNYLPSQTARLELNGQTLDQGDYAAREILPLPAACRDIPTSARAAFVDLNQPLTLRWQTFDDPDVWRTAEVQVPDFPMRLPEKERSAPTQVLLYLRLDGMVAAERYLEVGRIDGELAIRAAGMPDLALSYTFCGSIYSRYNPAVVKLLAD